MYKCVLFDMDGTLVNSYEGIFNSYQYTMGKMGNNFEGHEFVRNAIGAPLLFVFEKLCEMDKEKALQAVDYYRSYYAKKGKYQVKAYDGIKETLEKLKKSGYIIGTATLKNETFAKEILEELELLSYFDIVCGMDKDNRLTKADIIRLCMKHANTSHNETILVGDSEFDAIGAKEAGIDFLAVTYGFGFKDQKSLKDYNVKMVAENAYDIAKLLCEKETVKN